MFGTLDDEFVGLEKDSRPSDRIYIDSISFGWYATNADFIEISMHNT